MTAAAQGRLYPHSDRVIPKHAVRTAIAKHSVIVRGHKTSVSLEPPFWEALQVIAEERQMTRYALIALRDEASGRSKNLSSDLRVFVLDHYLHESERRD